MTSGTPLTRQSCSGPCKSCKQKDEQIAHQQRVVEILRHQAMAMEARMKNLEGMVSGVVQGEMTPAMKREIKSVVREREGELEQRRMDKEDAWERELGVS